MRHQTTVFRLSALLTATSLAIAPAWPFAAHAQPVPSQQGAPQASPDTDPPARVGRVAQLTGTVSFHTADEDQWQSATLNYPVTTGNAFWTEPQARADIEVSANSISMESSTELDIAQLDDQNFVGTVPQGEVCVSLRNLPSGQSYAFQTPRGTVQIASVGHYAIIAGDTEHPTTVTVLDGSAQVTGANLSLQVGANQMASVAGADNFQGSVGPSNGPDECLQDLLNAEHPQQPASSGAVAPPPVVQQMTGGADLSRYGTWASTPEYGDVWYPQVAQDWVPYRDGSWSYVGQWGWTWMSSEPWGFAPFHYGRWVQIGSRWGWTPVYPGYVESAPPVYAPALVSFFGVGAAVGIGVGAALASGHIGWVPLGPREPYYPWYRASPRYVGRLNVTNIRNINVVENNYRNVVINRNRTVINNYTINKFVNQRGVTVVPAAAMRDSRPVRQAVQHVDPKQWANARPVVAREPFNPTGQTHGLTPRVAQRLHVTEAPGGPGGNHAAPLPGRHPAPGPAIHSEALQRGGHVALRPVGASQQNQQQGPRGPEQHPNQPNHPAAPGPNRANEPNAAARPSGPHGAGEQRPGQPGAGPGHLPGLRAPNAPPPTEGHVGGPNHPAARPGGAPRPHAPGPNGQQPQGNSHPGGPQNPGGSGPAPRPAEPHAPGGFHAQEPPHAQAAPHTAPAPHPTAAVMPHPQPAPHPQAAPHPQPAPHPAPAAMPHPQPAPRPAPAPHPALAPHPAPAAHPAPAPHPAPQQRPQQQSHAAPRPQPQQAHAPHPQQQGSNSHREPGRG